MILTPPGTSRALSQPILAPVQTKKQLVPRLKESWISRCVSSMTIRGQNSPRSSRTWSWAPDGSRIRPWLHTLGCLHSMLMVTQTQNQHTVELFMVNIWKPLISTLTLEETSQSSLKSMVELSLEELSKSEHQVPDPPRKSQSRWLESPFLPELPQTRHSSQIVRFLLILSKECKPSPKPGSKPQLKSWRFCLQPSLKSTSKPRSR